MAAAAPPEPATGDKQALACFLLRAGLHSAHAGSSRVRLRCRCGGCGRIRHLAGLAETTGGGAELKGHSHRSHPIAAGNCVLGGDKLSIHPSRVVQQVANRDRRSRVCCTPTPGMPASILYNAGTAPRRTAIPLHPQRPAFHTLGHRRRRRTDRAGRECQRSGGPNACGDYVRGRNNPYIQPCGHSLDAAARAAAAGIGNAHIEQRCTYGPRGESAEGATAPILALGRSSRSAAIVEDDRPPGRRASLSNARRRPSYEALLGSRMKSSDGHA